jgi:hypothetical protein
LRGLVRLKSLIQGQSVKRQAASTLRCMQTLARVQSQIRSRRIRMSEDNQVLQRQLQQRCEKELEKLRTSVSAPILYSVAFVTVYRNHSFTQYMTQLLFGYAEFVIWLALFIIPLFCL